MVRFSDCVSSFQSLRGKSHHHRCQFRLAPLGRQPRLRQISSGSRDKLLQSDLVCNISRTYHPSRGISDANGFPKYYRNVCISSAFYTADREVVGLASLTSLTSSVSGEAGETPRRRIPCCFFTDSFCLALFVVDWSVRLRWIYLEFFA